MGTGVGGATRPEAVRRRAVCLGTLADGAERRRRHANVRAENGAASTRAFAGEKTVLREAAFAYRAEIAQLTIIWEERRNHNMGGATHH